MDILSIFVNDVDVCAYVVTSDNPNTINVIREAIAEGETNESALDRLNNSLAGMTIPLTE
jgi:hypothetical protein